MVILAQTLILVQATRRSIERGESPYRQLKQIALQELRNKSFQTSVLAWMRATETNGKYISWSGSQHHLATESFFILIYRSSKGEPIYPLLVELEQELVQLIEIKLEEKIAQMPFVLLIPLLFLLFPSLLILLLGPFFDLLQSGLFP